MAKYRNTSVERGFRILELLAERRQAVDDFPLVFLVLDRAEEGLFPFRRHVPARISHVTPHCSSSALGH